MENLGFGAWLHMLGWELGFDESISGVCAETYTYIFIQNSPGIKGGDQLTRSRELSQAVQGRKSFIPLEIVQAVHGNVKVPGPRGQHSNSR